MSQEIINIGAAANDGTGDPLRTAFDKVNNNFTQLYNTLAASGPDGSIQFKNTNTFYSTLYVADTYLVAGAPGRIYYSNDGAVWNEASTGTENAIYSLAYDGIDTVIAVGASGTILRSTDGGVTWTSSTSGVTENLYGAVGFNGSFAVVGANGTILTSHVGGEGYTQIPTVTIAAPANAGGITATATATIANGRVSGFTITEPGLGYNTAPTVTISNPTVAGITATATATVSGGIVTAVDLNSGVTWNEPVTGITATLTGVTHGNLTISSNVTPIYVATGVTGTIVTSTDLVTWGSVTTGTTEDLYSAVIDPLISKLIVVGENGTVLTTFNTSLWTTEDSNVSTTLTSIAYGVVDTITDLIAVGNVGTVIRSNNGGVNWYTASSSSTTNPLLGVAFVPNTANVTSSLFLAVGSNATVIESNITSLSNTWSLQSVGSALQGDANLLYFPGTQTLSANANIVPGTDSTFSLGTPNLKFTDLYLSGNSLHLGTVKITSNANNSITFAQSSNTANLTDLISDSITAQTASFYGNINVGNYVLANNVTTYNFSAANANIPNLISNVANANILNANTANIANLTSANANVTALTGGNANLTGNVTANYFFGNGAFLTGTGANTGNIGFIGNAIYSLGGMLVENADLTHGATGALIIPSNGNTTVPLQINNTYGNVEITTGVNPSSLKNWRFDTAGNLILPSNTSSINYANGEPYGARTGNVTFDDQIVIGTGDPYGGGGLYLAQGPDSVANLQYLRIRGGDNETHIHLDTGDNATYDQYFGDDNKYVKLGLGDYGNVTIGTQNPGENLRWTFDNVGDTTVPGDIQSITTGFAFTANINGIDTSTANVVRVLLTSDPFPSDVEGQVTISDVVGTTEANGTWYFVATEVNEFQLFYDEALDYPVDGTGWPAYVSGGLAFAAGYTNLSITGGNVSIINNNSDAWTFDSTGKINIPAGSNSFEKGRIQSANGYPTLLAYGSIGDHGGPELDWMDSDDPANTFWDNTVLRNTMYINDTGLYIGMNENGVANVDAPNWRFDPQGTTYFPDGTIAAGNIEATGNFGFETPANVGFGILADAGSYEWTFGTDGNLTAPGSVEMGTGNTGVQLRSNPTGTGFYATIAGITNGESTVVVTLNDVEFTEGEQDTVRITGVVGETEANGFWGWVAVDVDQIQLYTDGTLSTPVDGTTWNAYVSGGLAVSSGYNELDIQGGNVAIISGAGKYWSFAIDGNTIFPTLSTARGDTTSGTITGSTIRIGDGSQEAVITTPDGSVTTTNDSQRLIINPGQGYLNGEGGDIYLWAGRGGPGDQANAVSGGSGGDIKIRGGQGGANSGYGGYIRIEAGDGDFSGGQAGYVNITGGSGGSGQNGGYIRISGGTGDVVGGESNITGGYGSTGAGGAVNIIGGGSGNGLADYGNVNISAGSSIWTFDNAGTLTLPGEGVIRSNNDTIVLQSYDTANSIGYGLRVGDTGGLYLEQGSNQAWLTFNPFNSNAEIYAAMGTEGGAGKNITITAGAADQTDYYTTAGGNLNLLGGAGAGNDGGGGGPGGNVNITSGFSADPAGRYGNVNISTGGSNNWIFDYTGNLSAPGNINMNGKWVGNIGYAVANTDAASKLYVDTLVSTGISYHQPVNAASTTTLAVATGGTTAYNQPNGAGNGIGAYISTTGTFTTIDGVTINGSTSIRILVKDEANAAWNGVYNYTNATAITRTTDTDEYGVGSPSQLSINDYFFTQAGTVNKGTAFIVSAPSGTITFGTSDITFSTFSTSQVYTGGTGITISGTEISANASQTQITAVGTLGSLSVTGNTTSGNFVGTLANGNSSVAITSNANVTITATSNATMIITGTGANIAGTANISGNVSAGNLTVTGNITAIAGTATTSSTAASVGYQGIPQQSKATSYTTVIGDAGKHIYVTATATITIDSNANVAYPIGTSIMFIANTGATATIAINSDTLTLAGTGTTGSRTLAPFGMATAVKVTSTIWFISGNGLT